ncbi:hypothetical protein BCV44_04655 [Vibrio cyclitrophicus]|uniref:hypothetical protein n=1 Tax=Vibrio TaxID=662 RepID=UPI000631DAA8|nr:MULTISPECIES: hypothetical protein [Vibrio]PME09158.1 hypothetical protein BCV44_04655 [Vibrio cyclitrophicus]RLQ19904.1 hypothetical protein AYK60_07490 [Vibrio sp. SBT000027]CDU06688.1 hypothetical protein VCR12J2_80015 [Vibrio coralliirubri]
MNQLLPNVVEIKTIENGRNNEVNTHLELGWKLLNIANLEKYELNYITGDDEKVSYESFTLGWISGNGEVVHPN